MIYNAGSNFPSAGGSFGGLTLAGNGIISLTPMDSGTYADIVIFQSRDNTRTLSLSGNGSLSLHGGVTYASAALLSESGNAQSEGPIVVSRLQISGNVSSSALVAASGGAGTDATVGELLGGNLSLYVANPSGYLTQDERARIDDAIAGWDALLAPYHVTITEVAGADGADLVLEGATTSPVGGHDAVVLGTYEPGKITIVLGWSFYAGADPSGIGQGQYDFESLVYHELGHALGLGHSTAPDSVMYASLATGVARRTPTVTDLRIPDLNGDPVDALHAATPSSEENGVISYAPGHDLFSVERVARPDFFGTALPAMPPFAGVSGNVAHLPADPGAGSSVFPDVRGDLGGGPSPASRSVRVALSTTVAGPDPRMDAWERALAELKPIRSRPTPRMAVEECGGFLLEIARSLVPTDTISPDFPPGSVDTPADRDRPSTRGSERPDDREQEASLTYQGFGLVLGLALAGAIGAPDRANLKRRIKIRGGTPESIPGREP